MREVKNVLICGLGAIGSIYADKINSYCPLDLRILVDKTRYEKYKKCPKIYNGKELELNYILPENQDFKADLIIIAVKFDALNDAINNIYNFVKDDTIILSLLNGVTSEEIIAKKYGAKHIPLSYFIGHSAMRHGNTITFDGVGNIVFGVKDEKINDVNDIELLKSFFNKVGISYSIPDDMPYSMWLKFLLNVSSNQSSAILKMTFGQMQSNEKYLSFMRNIMNEVVSIAKAEGIKNTDKMIPQALELFSVMSKNGKTSMLQDIESGRKTEVGMFAGTVIELGEKHNLPTPYNNILKEMIEIIENDFT